MSENHSSRRDWKQHQRYREPAPEWAVDARRPSLPLGAKSSGRRQVRRDCGAGIARL